MLHRGAPGAGDIMAKTPLPSPTGETPPVQSVTQLPTGMATESVRWRGYPRSLEKPRSDGLGYYYGVQGRSKAALHLRDDVMTAYEIAEAPPTDTPKAEPATPAAPWEDTGGERQKEVCKRLEMEVNDVELAHKEAVRIIDGAGGYVAQEDLTATADSGSEANLSARIPVDRLEDAVARLRDLGRVVALHGTSEDRTAEYYGRGKQVRESSAEEARIVAQYEKEKDRAKRQALYARLTQVRSKLKSQKDTLQELGARTHYATVEVLLTQRQGAGEFVAQVGSRAVLALTWFLATALIWGPLLLLILTLHWRRPRADRPSEAPQE